LKRIINQALDELKIPNYDDIELRRQQEDVNDIKRKSYLTNALNKAKDKRKQLPGFSAQITKNLNNGSMSQAEAQMRRKLINDTRKVLNDYTNYNNQRLKNIKGSGLKKTNKKRWTGNVFQ